MKYLLAKFSLFLLLACQSRQQLAEQPKESLSQTPSEKSAPTLEELERRDYQDPKNPKIKMELATYYWCHGRRGLAVENWFWVRKNTRENSYEYRRADEFVELASTQASKLNRLLGCTEVNSQPGSTH